MTLKGPVHTEEERNSIEKKAAEVAGAENVVNNITVKFMIVYELTAQARARAVADITRMLETNLLIHNVAATFPLAEIAAAHEAVEQGKVAGNVVMAIS